MSPYRKIIEKLWKIKSKIRWITEIKEDMRELQITAEYLRKRQAHSRNSVINTPHKKKNLTSRDWEG